MNAIASFWEWWAAELASFWPRSDMRRSLLGRARYEIHLTKSGAKVLEWRGFRSCLSPGKLFREENDLLSALEGLQGQRVVVSLGDDLVLRRTISLPPMVERREADLLALDAERATPFQRSEIYFVWRRSVGNAVEQAIARRDYFVAITNALQKARCKLWGISVRSGDGEFWPNALAANGDRLGASNDRFWRRAALASLCIAGCIWFGTTALVNGRVQSKLDSLENEVATLAPVAKARRDAFNDLEQRLQELKRLRTERRTAISFPALWANVSEAMPDNGYLQILSLKGRQLVLTGLSSAPEALLARLEATPYFSNVRFMSPLTASPGVEQVQFTLAADVAPELEQVQ